MLLTIILKGMSKTFYIFGLISIFKSYKTDRYRTMFTFRGLLKDLGLPLPRLVCLSSLGEKYCWTVRNWTAEEQKQLISSMQFCV